MLPKWDYICPVNNEQPATMNTYTIPTLIVQGYTPAPARNRIWFENGVETMLCSFCGEWQKCFNGPACPTCVECAAIEGETID